MITIVSQIEDTRDLRDFIENNVQDEIGVELQNFNDEVFDFIFSMFEDSNISSIDLADFFRFEAFDIMKGFKIINSDLWEVSLEELFDLHNIVKDTVLEDEVDTTSLLEFLKNQKETIGFTELWKQYNQIREEFGYKSLNELMNVIGLTVEEIFTPKEAK